MFVVYKHVTPGGVTLRLILGLIDIRDAIIVEKCRYLAERYRY